MGERRHWPEDSGIADKNIELFPALIDRRAQPVERGIVLDVARDKRHLAARGADVVIELFERALAARKRNHMRAGARQFECDRAPNAARGAGDERDTAAEIARVRVLFRLGRRHERSVMLPPQASDKIVSEASPTLDDKWV